MSKKEIDCFPQTDAGAASRGQELFKFVVDADARLKRVWDDAVLGITIEFRELPIQIPVSGFEGRKRISYRATNEPEVSAEDFLGWPKLDLRDTSVAFERVRKLDSGLRNARHRSRG